MTLIHRNMSPPIQLVAFGTLGHLDVAYNKGVDFIALSMKRKTKVFSMIRKFPK